MDDDEPTGELMPADGAGAAPGPGLPAIPCSGNSEIAHVHRPLEPAGDEVSLALACSPGRAKNRVALAVELAENLTGTLEALHADGYGTPDQRIYPPFTLTV